MIETTNIAVSSDPPAADNYIVIIKHSRLSRRHGALGFVECHDHRTVFALRHRGLGLFGALADFDRDAGRFGQILDRDPVDAFDRHLALQQIVARSDHHTIVLRVHPYDVKRIGR